MKSRSNLVGPDRQARRNVAPHLLLLFLLVFYSASQLQAQVGNNNATGVSGIFSGQSHTGCSYDPFTGNATRAVTDISVSGAVGEYPLALVRTANSRTPSAAEVFGRAGGWNHNYNWILEDSPSSTVSNFQPSRYTVDFPDGRVETFRAVTWDPNYYRVRPGAETPAQSTSAGVRDRFMPISSPNTMVGYLILPDGGKVKFQATKHSFQQGGITHFYYKYSAQAIIDPYGLSTNFTYETTGLKRLLHVTEPAGRYLQFSYNGTNSPRISQVSASDGRTVSYYYVNYALEHVTYYSSPNWIAHYQYCGANVGGGLPLLWTADDPMYPGPMKRIAYEYRTTNNPDGTTPVYGQIQRERYWDGVQGHEASGAAVSTLVVGLPNNNPAYRTETRGDGPARTFVYTSVGHVTWVSDFTAHQSSQTYDTTTKYINSVTDFNGHTTDFTCDAVTGNITQIKYPLTNGDTPGQGNTRPTVNYSYTNNYYLHTIQDEGNHTTTFTRDANNRVTEIDYPDSGYETFSYTGNSFGEVTAHRMTTAGIETFTYDARGLKQTYRNPDNATGNPTARYRYDTLDRVTDITDVLGSSLGDPNHTTSLTYNNRGQLTVTTLAKDPVDNTRHTITNYYNPDGTLASKTNERYQSTSCTYDDYRRLRSVTPPVRGSGDSGTHITGYYYSAAGLNDDYRHTDVQPRWVVLPSGKKINTVYDDNLRKTSMTVALGTADAATTSYGYDNVGNVTSVVAPNQQPGQPFSGRSTSTAYDERNRPSSITDALNNITRFTYDTAGRKKSINRPNGQVITYNSFDLMNRVTQQTVQNSATQNAITKYNYYTIAHDGANAPVGLLRTMQDPYLVWTGSGDAYIYTYDTMGRKRSVTYPADAGGTHRIEYFVPDTVGRLWTYQNRNGNIQTFSYDALNRMSGFTWNDGSTPSVTFGYDTGSRLIEIDNANAHISRSYYNDDLLRVEHTEDANGNALGQVVYSYDEDGNRASAAVWPGNASFNYNYTGRNQLRALVDNNSGPTAYYWYDKNGNLTQRNPGNTTTTSYTPDALDRVTSIVHSLNGTTRTINYGYDTVSNNRKWIQRLITPTSAENNRGEVFSYDFADQVTAVQLDIQNPNTASAGNQTISYDPNGNRTRFQPPGHNEQYVTNNLNQYTSRNGTNAAYDTKGNLATGLDLSSYTYDAQNRLTGAIKSGVTEVFTYDGLNRQVSRNVGGVATYNVWDGWNLVAEYHDPASVLAKYVYGTGGLVKEMVSNNYYYQDGSGSTSHLATSGGALLEWYRYDLQGTPFFYNSSDQMIGGSNAGVRHLFTGQQWYSELGLYDLRNRFYSPDIGRFLQPDPIGFRGGNNLYRYCGNNPVTRRDPFGLSGTPPTNVDPSPQYPTAVFPRVTVPGESPNTFWREPGGFGGPGGFVPSIGSDNPAAHRGYNPFPRPPPEDDQPSVQHPAPSSVPPQNPPPPQAPAPVSPASPSAPAAGVFSHWGQLASPIVSPEVNMRLDDDGSGPKHGDSKHQNFVSYYWFYGVNLNADTDAYVVAPRYALSQGVMLGDLAFVIGNATWTPAIVGDVGSSANGWGEVSLRTAWNLGVPTIDAPGGRGPVIPQSFGPVPVTIIVIPTRP